MCGRYYVEEGFTNEIKRICKKIDESAIRKGDVIPATEAPLIRNDHHDFVIEKSIWGFQNKYGTVINARAESLHSTPMFAKYLDKGRCIIPASGFYEWNKNKDMFQFFPLENERILYMAGLYHFDGMTCHHVIITTQANDSMKKVHDRMPLILTERQLPIWLDALAPAEKILTIEPPELGSYSENEQLEFHFD